jgi:hypothetical protein
MLPSLKFKLPARLGLLVGLLGLVLVSPAIARELGAELLAEPVGLRAPALEPGGSANFQAQPAATAPRFVYGSGAQGVGYYPYTAPRAATTPAATRPAAPATVGPGVRNWSTGRRSPLHRPWLRAM